MKALKQSLLIFLILYCYSVISGELSLLLLAVFPGLSFTFQEPGGSDLPSELINEMPFIAKMSLFIVPIPTTFISLVMKLDFRSKYRRKELVKLSSIVFLFLLGLWYLFFMFLMTLYGYGRK